MSDRKHVLIGVALAAPILAAASAAHAQRADDPQSVLAAAPAPSAQARVSPLSAFSLEAGEKGATASLKLGAQWNAILGGPGQAVGRFQTASITFSTPVDDKKSFSAPLTHDGLGGGASVELQLSQLNVPSVDTTVVDSGPVCDQIKALAAQTQPEKKFEGCSTHLAAEVGGLQLAQEFEKAVREEPACGKIQAEYRRRNPDKDVPACSSDLAKELGGELEVEYRAAVGQLPACRKIKAAFAKANAGRAISDCSAAVARLYGGIDLERNYNAAIDALYAARRITYYGVSGKVGDQSYAFHDPATLVKSEVERTPWRVGVFHSWISGAQNRIVTVEYGHEVSFKEGDKKIACLAGPGPVLPCVSGSLERVKRVAKDVLSLEARWTPGAPGVTKAKVGFAPKVSYDANNDDWAVALPVYLFGNREGLTGGVRADWNSDDHDVVVGVFLTKTLSITDVFS